MTETSDPEFRHDPYSALRVPEFRRYLGGNLLALLGSQMQTVAVGWELYERTGEPLDLGLVGLVQVIPVVALAMPAGQIVDRMDRRRVILLATCVLLACSLALAAVSWTGAGVAWVYASLLVNGIARAFLQPAKSSLVPMIVPRPRFTNAVTWSTSGFQLATIVGPGLGGLAIGLFHQAWVVYLLDAALTAAFVVQLLRLPPQRPAAPGRPVTLRSLVGGVEYVWRTKLVLGAISLDMFAVLLGGATALLPIYAKDILQVGPEGLGYLRAAPGIGAILTSFGLAHLPPMRRAGPVLLASVAGFGVATVLFGLTRNFGVALSMLFLTGALDMISVIIRHTLVQTWTPDEMRGRVSAVNGMFISVSNELGAFESGAVAAWFHRPDDPEHGPTVSVVSGGIGTILVVLAMWRLVPSLRRYDRLTDGPTTDRPSTDGPTSEENT